MTDCKNCKMTDEYCASGDCPNDTLTEQWRKGELPDGEYWCLSVCSDVDRLYCHQNSFWVYKTEDDYYGLPVEIKEVLAPVPSYDEYMTMKDCAKKEFEAVEKYTKIKELLKECRQLMLKQIFYRNVPVESDEIYKNRCLKKEELITKIDEVLK